MIFLNFTPKTEKLAEVETIIKRYEGTYEIKRGEFETVLSFGCPTVKQAYAMADQIAKLCDYHDIDFDGNDVAALVPQPE